MPDHPPRPAGGQPASPRKHAGDRPAHPRKPAGDERSSQSARSGQSGRPRKPGDERSGQPGRDRKPGEDRSARPGRPRTAAGDERRGQPANSGRPAREPRPGRPAARRPDSDRARRPAGPPLPEGADPALLPPEVRRELRNIAPGVAERVAGHLVAAGQLIDTDPAAAYEHAKAAKTIAPRLGAVREAAGVAAYVAGDYAAALADLKAARRITGQPDHLPLIADCERALGRPDRALDAARDPERVRLDTAARVELLIVESGARRDLGQPAAAVLALQGRELDSDAVEAWTVRLWYAYADALLAAGRTADAVQWFGAAAAIDEDGETDAAERLAELNPPDAPA